MKKIKRSEMTPELLKTFVRYNEADNELKWLPRPRSLFQSDARCRGWNERWAGTNAGGMVMMGVKSGTFDKWRTRIQICGVPYSAIKVVWCLTYGEWPEGQIELRDGNQCHWWPSNLLRSDAWQRQVDEERKREGAEVSFL